MSWKRGRDKELTKEEALEIAKREAAPHWVGSNPLLTAARVGDRIIVYPLDEAFQKSSWLIAFLDPSHVHGETAIRFVKEWNSRFHMFEVKVLLVLKPVYSFFRDKKYIKFFLESNSMQFPVVIDEGAAIEKAFEVSGSPHILFFNQNQIVARADGIGQFSDFELAIHKFLRQESPGLALYPPFEDYQRRAVEAYSVDFGERRDARITSTEVSGIDTDQIKTLASVDRSSVVISGPHKRDVESIIVSDPATQVFFLMGCGGLSLACRAPEKSPDSAKIFIEASGRGIPEEFKTEIIKYDDQGRTFFEAREPDLYHICHGLPERLREIAIRCPYSKRIPAVIYGFRASN